MNTHHKNAKPTQARKALIAVIAVASIALGALAVPAHADAGPRTGSDRIDLSGCDSPATVLENCVDNTGVAFVVGQSIATSGVLKAAAIDLGGPRTGSDRIDLSGCDSPATVLENCVD